MDKKGKGQDPPNKETSAASSTITSGAAEDNASTSPDALETELKAQRLDMIAPAYRKTSIAKAYANALAEIVKEDPGLQDSIGEMVLLLDEAVVDNLEGVRYAGGLCNLESDLDTYNNVEEHWRLLLKSPPEIVTESSTTESNSRVSVDDNKVWVTAVDVDQKVKERGWKRKRPLI